VDWDAVQGDDLTYSERVSKLDQQLGVSTRTKARREIIQALRCGGLQVGGQPEAYQGELEAASREMFYDMKAEAY